MVSILCITGRGGSLDRGLAEYLSGIADDFEGMAVDTEFLRQKPLDQVAVIQRKIVNDPTRLVIANSYGAYLRLQALIDLKVTPDRVLLLSPVLGIAQAKDRMYMSRPPLTKRLQSAFNEQTITKPNSIKLLIGGLESTQLNGTCMQILLIIGFTLYIIKLILVKEGSCGPSRQPTLLMSGSML